MGWFVLGFLTAFAVLDAVALALRVEPRGRAELGIAAASFFAALLGMPILALGYANLLWRATLAPTSLVLLVVVFGLLARRDGPRAVLTSSLEAMRGLVALPLDALRRAFAARSIVFAGLLVAASLIGISLVLTYLIEFCRWDDEIYHTPIVGWAIQQHGFQIVDIPKPGGGGLNGYPKLCEGLSLWFVIFTDKRLLELPATLFAAPVMLCVYAMARRYTDAICAMGFAVVILLVPHAWRQFCSSYVDMEMAFFLLAATYWASRPEHRFRDSLMCAVAMALAAGSKTTWLLFVPPVALVDYTRLVREYFPSRRRQVVLAVAGSMAAVLGVGALCIVRNWWHYGNPVWPVAYEIPKLGIHWPGLFTPTDYKGHDPPVVEGYEVPQGGMHDVMRHGYGLAVMWVAGPVGVLAVAIWAIALVRQLGRRAPVANAASVESVESPAVAAGVESPAAAAGVESAAESALGVSAVLVPFLIWLAVGPNFGQPRYNLHVVGVLLVACAWLLRGRPQERLREGLLGAMLVLSIIPFFWMSNANVTTLEEEKERLLHPFDNRAYSAHPSFDLLEREKYEELKPGDEVVFSQGVIFPGILWNFDFSNRVDYVEFRSGPEFLAKLAELRPKWVCVGADSAAKKVLEQSGQWVLIGRTTQETKEVAFRRKDAAEPRG
jgi:hypothetical protein